MLRLMQGHGTDMNALAKSPLVAIKSPQVAVGLLTLLRYSNKHGARTYISKFNDDEQRRREIVREGNTAGASENQVSEEDLVTSRGELASAIRLLSVTIMRKIFGQSHFADLFRTELVRDATVKIKGKLKGKKVMSGQATTKLNESSWKRNALRADIELLMHACCGEPESLRDLCDRIDESEAVQAEQEAKEEKEAEGKGERQRQRFHAFQSAPQPTRRAPSLTPEDLRLGLQEVLVRHRLESEEASERGRALFDIWHDKCAALDEYFNDGAVADATSSAQKMKREGKSDSEIDAHMHDLRTRARELGCSFVTTRYNRLWHRKWWVCHAAPNRRMCTACALAHFKPTNVMEVPNADLSGNNTLRVADYCRFGAGEIEREAEQHVRSADEEKGKQRRDSEMLLKLSAVSAFDDAIEEGQVFDKSEFGKIDWESPDAFYALLGSIGTEINSRVGELLRRIALSLFSQQESEYPKHLLPKCIDDFGFDLEPRWGHEIEPRRMHLAELVVLLALGQVRRTTHSPSSFVPASSPKPRPRLL